MQVADKVKQKLERQQALRRKRARGVQFGLELLDLVDDAVLSGAGAREAAGGREAEAGARQVRLRQLDVGEVPLSRLAVACAAKCVGPGRLRRHVMGREGVDVGRQQGVDLRPNCRREQVASDVGDDLVALVSPRGSGRR